MLQPTLHLTFMRFICGILLFGLCGFNMNVYLFLTVASPRNKQNDECAFHLTKNLLYATERAG